MHWLLSVPEAFSLREVIRRSGWLLRPPFHDRSPGDRLHRVERLATVEAVDLTIYQAPVGLVLRTEAHLSGQEIQEASEKVWRMLRLEEDLQPFLRIAQRCEALDTVNRLGARLLRGTTLFEDVVTAAAAESGVAGPPDFTAIAALVDRLGTPLPSNPTLHTFPSPQRVRDGAAELEGVLSTPLITRLAWIARTFTEQRRQIEVAVRRPIAAEELAHRLMALLHLEEASLGLLMLSLGRYDYLPTDSVARQRIQHAWHLERPAGPQDVRTFLEPWQPWGGLAYWLWDWTRVPAPTTGLQPR